MIRLSNTIWLVALGGLTWFAMPAGAALGSIATDWDTNEAVLKSVAQMAAGGAGSRSSTGGKHRWQPEEEEPAPVDELAATLPSDSGTPSSSGASQTSSGSGASLLFVSTSQFSPDISGSSWLTAEFSSRLPEPLSTGIFHPPRAVLR